jgi:hypothetical protein
VSIVTIPDSEGKPFAIHISEDGDYFVVVENRACRFCTYTGGGSTPKVRAAILGLMVAMEDEGATVAGRSPKEIQDACAENQRLIDAFKVRG